MLSDQMVKTYKQYLVMCTGSSAATPFSTPSALKDAGLPIAHGRVYHLQISTLENRVHGIKVLELVHRAESMLIA